MRTISTSAIVTTSSPAVRTDDEITDILGLNLDTTERIGAEEGLRESERRLFQHMRQTQKDRIARPTGGGDGA